MAKVSDIKFEIGGQKIVVNINCNSGGQFTAIIPKLVADELDLDANIREDKMSDVVSKVHDAVNKYKTAKTSEELYIAIQYGSNGEFNSDSKGNSLHGSNRYDSYAIDISFQKHENAISFAYKVCIKRTVAGVIKWYDAKLWKDMHTASWEEKRKANQWYRESEFTDSEEWKMIPFSKGALESLNNAKEKLRSISELLFKFIEQDEKMIESTLTNTKFLK